MSKFLSGIFIGFILSAIFFWLEHRPPKRTVHSHDASLEKWLGTKKVIEVDLMQDFEQMTCDSFMYSGVSRLHPESDTSFIIKNWKPVVRIYGKDTTRYYLGDTIRVIPCFEYPKGQGDSVLVWDHSDSAIIKTHT